MAQVHQTLVGGNNRLDHRNHDQEKAASVGSFVVYLVQNDSNRKWNHTETLERRACPGFARVEYRGLDSVSERQNRHPNPRPHHHHHPPLPHRCSPPNRPDVLSSCLFHLRRHSSLDDELRPGEQPVGLVSSPNAVWPAWMVRTTICTSLRTNRCLEKYHPCCPRV